MMSLLRQVRHMSTAASAPSGFLKVSAEQIKPLLLANQHIFAKVHMHNNAYLVTKGDQMRLPYRFKGLKVGDVINFEHVSQIGSRDHVFQGDKYISQDHFNIEGVVTALTAEPMTTHVHHRIKDKGYTRTQRKVPQTIIRISELELKA